MSNKIKHLGKIYSGSLANARRFYSTQGDPLKLRPENVKNSLTASQNYMFICCHSDLKSHVILMT